ncbi:TrbC/VirB2 family protein [Xanthomonas theicola]|uniref:Type VI secretion protein n=1 Tax=Xanthomonas theicola TaxID=56464 RepID=A0A2S6ZCZ3_9XANT|nr:TrbC/VirB2 family protein [Xanthomonas theicola]PPT88410.1 type VI secretion protein [Xanthomonas theicola]QNH24598.1 TrbC/VirB2 family protein [Xanthomonas theicola]
MKLNKIEISAGTNVAGMAALKSMLFVIALLAANVAMATSGYAGADKKVCGFLSNVNNILNMGSVAVVTIAVIVAGYQIAFAHKRISEVSPILIGGVLIGAAGQLANMLIGDTGQTSCIKSTGSLVMQAIQHYA